MKFPFSEYLVDELGPLRELRSPFSTSAIRGHMLERMASASLWGQWRNILAEFLVASVAGLAVLNMAGPVELHYAIRPIEVHRTAWKNGTVKMTEIEKSYNMRANRTNRVANHTVLDEKPLYSIKLDESVPIFSGFTLRTESIGLTRANDYFYPLQNIRYQAPNIYSSLWFASASGGMIFSQIRMMGEHAEIGFRDEWKTIALSYSRGDGTRDLRDEIAHHPGSTVPILSKESAREFSILMGAAFQEGPLELRAMAGPVFHSSSYAYYTISTGVTSTPSSLQSFGAAAEISALYPMNSSFGIGIACTANYQSRQFTGGLFASIEYQFRP